MYGFPEDPRSTLGTQRYQKAVKKFRIVVKHEWFGDIIRRKKIRILEICSGMGIGGVALAKVLGEKNVDVDLILTDLRDDALKIAKEWGSRKLGKDIEIIKIDAKEIHTLGTKVNIILMYGLSASHFNPWDMIRLLASTSETLVDKGIIIMEESDRIYRIFYQQGYKEVLPERINGKRIIVTAHAGYNMAKGTFDRAVVVLTSEELDAIKGYLENGRARIDLVNRSKPVILAYYFWGLAELMAFTWLFFEDVDFIKDPEGNIMQGFIVARKPRRKITSTTFVKDPKILRRETKGEN